MSRIIKSEHTRWVDGKWLVAATPLGTSETGEGGTEPEAPAVDPAQLVAEAEAKVQAMLEAAEARVQAVAEEARQLGYQHGLQQGHEEAYAQGIAQWQGQFQAFQLEAEAFLARREALLAEAEPDLVRLSLMIASKILTREPKDANLIRGMVQAAIARLNGETVVRVRLNPQDAGKLNNPLQGPPKFEVVADPEIGCGGVVVETQTGRVDATFASQFDEIVRAVLEADADSDPALKGAAGDLRKVPPAPAKGGGRAPMGGFGPGGFGR
ncbi:MAG TPA: FliH/SctL family protein [Stenomitos sp.]